MLIENNNCFMSIVNVNSKYLCKVIKDLTENVFSSRVKINCFNITYIKY